MYTQYLWPISPISPMQCFYNDARAPSPAALVVGLLIM